jgi:type II secretory pathway component PulL
VTGFFDIKDKNGGTLYLFEGERVAREIPFTLKEDFSISPTETITGLADSYLSLPVSMLNFRTLEFPFGELDKVRQALPFELEGLVLKGTDEIVMDAFPVSQTDTTYKVAAVYAEKNALRKMLDSLSALNTEPRVIGSIELREIKDSGKSIQEALMEHSVPGGEGRVVLAREEMAAPLINLRRGPLAYTREKEEMRRSLRLSAILMGLILMVFSATLGVKIYALNKERSEVDNYIRRSYTQTLGQPPPAGASPSTILKSKIRELEERKNFLSGVPALKIMRSLTALKPQGMAFNDIAMTKERVTVKGEAPSIAEVEGLKQKMSRDFKEAQIVETRTSEDKITFTLSLKP